MRYPATLLSVVLCLACGSSNEEPCPAGEVRIGNACVIVSPDSGVPDSSVDISASEVCNGLDDDLDGMTDEADPMLGESCGNDMGVCTIGANVCTNGALVCDGVQPSDETCNGLDDDCDGVVDEDAEQDFYLDEDGDGYGTGDACTACAPADCGEEIWVTMDGDCDETCDTCFPGGTEVCDGFDNNCDTLVDEGVQVLLYEDTDGDGYGVGVGEAGCLDAEGHAPMGFSAEDGDCGRDDSRAFPGATAYSTPIEGEFGAGGDYDFNCDGEELFAHPMCDRTEEGDIIAVCRPTPGYCWFRLASSGECGDSAQRAPVSGTTVVPGVSDGVCRRTSDDSESYRLACR